MGTSGNEIPAALFHRRVPAADRRLHVRECAVRTFLSPDPDVQLAERAEAGRLRIKETTVNLDSPRSQSKKTGARGWPGRWSRRCNPQLGLHRCNPAGPLLRREPRGGIAGGLWKDFAAGFVFALETLDF